MNIRIKLFASLGKYLPDGKDDDAKGNETDLDVADGASVGDVINHVGVPGEHCHLVLVNGVFISPGERDGYELSADDHLAIWPPGAGGGENKDAGGGENKYAGGSKNKYAGG